MLDKNRKTQQPNRGTIIPESPKQESIEKGSTPQGSPPLSQRDSTPLAETPHYVVGIGASAGGLESLQKFFSNLPVDTEMSFIVVQHLSPDYKSLLDEILRKYTPLPVYVAQDGIAIEPNSVYVLPPKKLIRIKDSTLKLEERVEKVFYPINYLFESIARTLGIRGVGIILSGSGSDGTLGTRAIKEQGGFVLFQSVESAKFAGMPKSAIATGLADIICTPEEMPEKLLQLRNSHMPGKIIAPDEWGAQKEENFRRILNLFQSEFGVDFGGYKRKTIWRRLNRRMHIRQIPTLDRYYQYLYQSETERKVLFKEFLIGVTRFFRDEDAFKILAEHIIPLLFQQNRDTHKVRVWVAGCATGEEAYSLAILLNEWLEKTTEPFEVKIFATDIDRDAVAFASSGIYAEGTLAGLSKHRLDKFFMRNNDLFFQVQDQIRKMIIFAVHNVMQDPPFSKIDLLVCRNLLIYLGHDAQQKVLRIFHFALKPGGFLFLGSAESASPLSQHFIPISTKWNIYRVKGDLKDIDFSQPQIPSYNNIALPRRLLKNTTTIPEKYYAGDALEEVLGVYIPPAIIINEDFELIHIYGDVNSLLKYPPGKPTRNLLDLIHPSLSAAVSKSVNKAKVEGKYIALEEIPFHDGDKVKTINLIVKPLRSTTSEKRTLIVIFEEKGERKTLPEDVESFRLEENYSQRIFDLERELQYNQENLQATIEELETSNEELQSTNEELVASNEELQSVNEELQSVNEELITVNTEYQNKIEELTQLNLDINNLLSSNGIGTVYLDKDLRVRKFSNLQNVINLIDSDLRRDIRDISHHLFYKDLFADIQLVNENGKMKQLSVKSDTGQFFIIRIQPYYSTHNRQDGVFITIVNLDDWFANLDSHPEILINPNGIIVSLSIYAKILLGLPEKMLVGNPVEQLFSFLDEKDMLIKGEPLFGAKDFPPKPGNPLYLAPKGPIIESKEKSWALPHRMPCHISPVVDSDGNQVVYRLFFRINDHSPPDKRSQWGS